MHGKLRREDIEVGHAGESQGQASFDAVAAEMERLDRAALAIDQAWGQFIAARAELEAIDGATHGSDAEPGSVADGTVDADRCSDQDPVRSLLAEARARLHRAQIEVVVSGFLNRGKSTLINALLGVEVSSMRVTPETARPVYVKHGPRRAWVAYPSPDGHGEQLEEIDPAEAAAFGGYRPEEAEDGGRKPLRVVQQLPVDLLRSGVMLKDTPGLDDANPALADELERLTLAELDRATVTLVVLCCPPGLSGSEMRILEGLDARRVDKVFVVCNFWSDVWEDEDEREAVLRHVRRSINGTSAEAARIVPVHAKRAWLARAKGDEAAFRASGVADLADQLELYLAQGVYRDVIDRSEAFLAAARDEVIRRIDERLAMLRDQPGLEARRAEKVAAVDAARDRLDQIAADAHTQIQSVASAACAELAAPFDQLAAGVQAAGSATDLNAAGMRFDVQYEAALARTSVLVREQLRAAEQEAKRRLAEAFSEGGSARVSLYGVDESFEFLRVAANIDHRSSPDWGDVWLGATAGALVGGALAGGAGIALLALGPAGWLAGAALGFVLGGTLFAGLSASSSGISGADRQRLLHQIEGQRNAATDGLRSQLDASARQLEDELRGLLSDFASEELEELAAVEAVVSDARRRSALEAEAEAVRSSVSGLRLG